MSQPWVTITEDNVLDSMTLKEREDFGRASTAVGRPDRLPGIIADFVAEVRGHIATWTPNTLSADPAMIPPSFRSRALIVIRHLLLTSVPDYDPGEARVEVYKAAELFFRQVAKGEIRPEKAPDAVQPEVPTQLPSGVEWQAPDSRTGRERMNGL